MQKFIDLDARTIVVTGAGQGIGLSLCKAALSLGANVAGIDMKDGQMPELKKEYPERFLALTGDVADEAFAAYGVSKIEDRFGEIHGLVNNAGIIRPAMIEKMSLDQWNDVLRVHLTGSFLWLQAVGRSMLNRAKSNPEFRGSIVNISSDAGRRGSIGQINYSTAKAGILGMTMSAAREWSKYEIRTNSIAYGVVETPMTETIRSEKFRESIISQVPMGRWAQPEEVVKTVCFLLSNASSYMTGQHLNVNGGSHMAS